MSEKEAPTKPWAQRHRLERRFFDQTTYNHRYSQIYVLF